MSEKRIGLVGLGAMGMGMATLLALRGLHRSCVRRAP